MECPKCKAKVGMMQHMLMVNTGAVDCVKCYICGYWVQGEYVPVRKPTPGCGAGLGWGGKSAARAEARNATSP